MARAIRGAAASAEDGPLRIRLVILGTEPLAKDGTYVYDTGDLAGVDAKQAIGEIEAFILRSLKELYRLKIAP